jgi:hypothetical protein
MAMAPESRSSAATHNHRGPGRLVRLGAARQGRALQPELVQEARATDADRLPPTVASTPRPGSARKSCGESTATPRSAAASRIALARGCSLPRCAAAARARRRPSSPSSASTSRTVGLPSVSVPVLSKATTAAACARSSASASRNRIPLLARGAVPTMSAAGVARPSAQGKQ